VDDGRFDDLEMGEMSIARHVERGIADMQDLAARGGGAGDLGRIG
jgi:hypothetical protein